MQQQTPGDGVSVFPPERLEVPNISMGRPHRGLDLDPNEPISSLNDRVDLLP